MFRGTIEEHGGIKIIGMDTITDVQEEDAGHLVIAASHGGVSSGSYAIRYPLLAAFFNDAGVGKENAGIAALSMLEESATAGGTYSHNTARIGDVLDAWENGVISRVNNSARHKGLREGDRVKDALRRIAGAGRG